ncbi:MAG: ABC transporter substrate-binding protein [Chloroflexota bacterium]
MTTAAKTLVYRTALGSYGHTEALKNGTVNPRGIKLDWVDVGPDIIKGFPRMCRELAFDISELALTTYLTARAFNKPFTMIPVVVARNFHHAAISYHVKSGITKPKDIEGKRVAVRSYTVTAGVWNRGILASEYGVDLSKVTWVTFEEPHVQEYVSPTNVVRAPEGKTLVGMLQAGEVDAAIGAGAPSTPDIRYLIDNPNEAAADWYKRNGIYPVNHTVVIQDKVLQAEQWVAEELFNALRTSKDLYVQRLRSSGPANAEDENRTRAMAILGGADPLPYGVEANRKGLETLIKFAADKKILPRPYRLDEFIPSWMHGFK